MPVRCEPPSLAEETLQTKTPFLLISVCVSTASKDQWSRSEPRGPLKVFMTDNLGSQSGEMHTSIKIKPIICSLNIKMPGERTGRCASFNSVLTQDLVVRFVIAFMTTLNSLSAEFVSLQVRRITFCPSRPNEVRVLKPLYLLNHKEFCLRASQGLHG